MRFVFGLLSVLSVSAALGDTLGQADSRGVGGVAEIFQAEGLDGTFVLASSAGEILYVHNDERSRTRYSPASTFKILNTLIALDAAVVTSKNSEFIWDGKDRGVAAWNRDQTLESAFRVSCVWCYQQIAREVGNSRYLVALANNSYGNQYVGDQVDQFWLNDDLQISALGQIEFLVKLVNYSLPFSRQHVDILKAIMLDESGTDYAIYAKTGWTGPGLHVGWYVGFVEKRDKTWLFAMNMRMDRAEQASLRKELSVRSLKILGIL